MIGERNCALINPCNIEQAMDISNFLSRIYDSLQKRNVAERIETCLYIARSDPPVRVGVIAIVESL